MYMKTYTKFESIPKDQPQRIEKHVGNEENEYCHMQRVRMDVQETVVGLSPNVDDGIDQKRELQARTNGMEESIFGFNEVTCQL